VSKAKRSVVVVSPISRTRSSACGKGSEAEPILQKAIKRAAAKSGTNSSTSPQFLAFSSMSDLHFLGVVDDCGLVLGDGLSFPSPLAFLSVIHANEVTRIRLLKPLRLQLRRNYSKSRRNLRQPRQMNLPV
jgi:hypothetical protein